MTTNLCSELWMGTHQNGPCKISNGQLLSAWIKENENEALGKYIKTEFPDIQAGELPFLFKILSIATGNI